MPDYSEAKIYKIIDNTNDNIYIGSTCQKLSQRLSEHVRHFKQYKEGKKVSYVTSFKIIENEDYDIILIKEYNCETKEQLLKIFNPKTEKLLSSKIIISPISKYNLSYFTIS